MRSASVCSGARPRSSLLHQPLQTGQHRFGRDGVTRTTSTPPPFRVPPVTRSPGPCSHRQRFAGEHGLVHGRPPLTTSPSSGTVSPARTRMSAPTGTLSGGTSSPVVVDGVDDSRAVGGRNPSSECMARAARARARASTARPVTRMATINGAMTPCRRGESPPPPRWSCRPSRAMASTALTARAANVPSGDERVHARRPVGAAIGPSSAGTASRRRPRPPRPGRERSSRRPVLDSGATGRRPARPGQRPRDGGPQAPVLDRLPDHGPVVGCPGRPYSRPRPPPRTDRRSRHRARVVGHERPGGGQIHRRTEHSHLISQGPLDTRGRHCSAYRSRRARRWRGGAPRPRSRARDSKAR